MWLSDGDCPVGCGAINRKDVGLTDSHHPVRADVLRLADAMASRLCLNILLRILRKHTNAMSKHTGPNAMSKHTRPNAMSKHTRPNAMSEHPCSLGENLATDCAIEAPVKELSNELLLRLQTSYQSTIAELLKRHQRAIKSY